MSIQNKRAWLYCRVDAPEDVHGRLKGQEKELMDYAEQMGFEVAGVSQDTGSGLNYERNGLAEVITAATKGEMDVLVVMNLSRLGRDGLKTWEFIRGLTQLGIDLYSPLEGQMRFSFNQMLSAELVNALKKESSSQITELPYLVGYVPTAEGGNESRLLKVTPTNIAAFIAKNAAHDITITTPFDISFLTTYGGFVHYCADQKFLRTELLPVLIPMQRGEVEPPEIEFVSMDEPDISEEANEKSPEADSHDLKFKV